MSLKINTDIALGRSPLTKQQLSEKERSDRENHRTPVQYCLSAINCLLLMGRYEPDCNFNYLTIGFFDDAVVEEALEILRNDGDWRAQIIGRSEERGVRIE